MDARWGNGSTKTIALPSEMEIAALDTCSYTAYGKPRGRRSLHAVMALTTRSDNTERGKAQFDNRAGPRSRGRMQMLGLNRTDCGEHTLRNIAAPEKWQTTRCVDGDMEARAGHTERASEYPYQRTDQKGIVGFISRSLTLSATWQKYPSLHDGSMHCIEICVLKRR